MQSYYTFIALEIAHERALEAQMHRLARGRSGRGSRLSRLLRELAGHVGAAFSGRTAGAPAGPGT